MTATPCTSSCTHGGDDLVDRAVVAEVDHLGALALEDPPHDVDGGVVAVEQAGGGDEPHRVDGDVQVGRLAPWGHLSNVRGVSRPTRIYLDIRLSVHQRLRRKTYPGAVGPRQLPFDPIAEARRQWDDRWGRGAPWRRPRRSCGPSRSCLGPVDEALRPFELTFARYEALVLLRSPAGRAARSARWASA